MFQFFLLIIIFGFEITALNNPFLKIPDCKIYWEGNFYFTDLSNGIEYKVIREKKSQIIFIINPENYSAKHEIIWVTDCIYKVIIVEFNHPEINSQVKIGDSFLVQITNNRTKDFYQYSYVATDGKKYLNKMYVSKK